MTGMITLSAIKADIGGYAGHSSSDPDILALANEWMKKFEGRFTGLE